MIIKGKSVGGADRLAKHLTRADTNERVEVKELRGVVAEDLRGALLEIEAVSSGTRTTKPFYHASISSRAEERLTDEQRAHAINRLEAELGLTGQARVVVVHEKEGREHCHIVWSRIDLERMAAISDSHNYRKHELVARELEREFGHDRVQGAHIERDGKERPKRTPSHAEMLQAERTGMTPQEAKEKITELWRTTDSGQAFAVALWEHGLVLARGDRRDFVVIDPMGGTHSLSRRIEGANAKDVRTRMADMDPARLPTVAEAKRIQEQRQALNVTIGAAEEQRPNPAQVDDDGKTKRNISPDMEWTDQGGMVAQQRSALEWVKKSDKALTARTAQATSSEKASDTRQAANERMQRLLSELAPQEENDLGDERGPSRDRDRSR